MYQEVITDRKWSEECQDMLIRIRHRRARLLDFWPPIWLFLRIVWRDGYGGRLNARTAWEVSLGVRDSRPKAN